MLLFSKFRWYLFVLVFAFSLLQGILAHAEAVDPPEKIFSVQFGAFNTQDEADACKRRFEELGYEPIRIEFQDPYYKVLYGYFEYYVYAVIQKNWIRSSGHCPDAFVRSRKYSGPQELNYKNVSPVSKIFTLNVDRITSCPDPQIAEDEPPVATIKALIEQQNFDAAETQLETLMLDTPIENAVAGWARYHLGKIKRQKKSADDALALFKQLTDGEVGCRRLERIYAMRQVAAVQHIDKDDRLKALQAYGELEKFCADDETRAWCKVQRAGIIFELVQSEAATWKEARRACKQVLAEVPETIRQHRATAELMYIETYFWEKENQRVLDLMPAFLEQYSDIKREYVAGMWLMGLANESLGYNEDAIYWFLKMHNVGFTDAEGFRGVDLLQRSAFWLAGTYARLGDLKNVDVWLNYLKDNYPDSEITRRAWSLLGGHRK